MTQSYDKNHYTNRKWKNPIDNTKTAPKDFDYTAIADRLRTLSWRYNMHPTTIAHRLWTLSWSSNKHPTGVVKRINVTGTQPSN